MIEDKTVRTQPNVRTHPVECEDSSCVKWQLTVCNHGLTLCEVKKTGGQNGWAQEAQKDGGTNKIVAEVFFPMLSAVFAETCKHFSQFTIEDNKFSMRY